MENSFKSVIEKSKSILILLPTRPYFDQAAAGLSLYLALRDQMEVQISSPTPMTVELNRLVGVNKITQDLGNKNLVIKFSNYQANDIERVSYDIENGQFQLTVIPKQNVNPPAKEQVEFSYAGISVDTVIIIGGANESHFPAISSKDLEGANLIHIGTRDITLSSGKTFVSFSRPASSVSEIIYGLAKEGGYKITQDIATNLLLGMEKASNNFAGDGVSSQTFNIVSELMKIGGQRQSSIPALKSYPPGAVPGTLPQTGLPAQAGYPPQMGALGYPSGQTSLPTQTGFPAQTNYPKPQMQAGQFGQSQQRQPFGKSSTQQQMPHRSSQFQQSDQFQPQTQKPTPQLGRSLLGSQLQQPARQPSQPFQTQQSSMNKAGQSQFQPSQTQQSQKPQSSQTAGGNGQKNSQNSVPQDWLEPRIYKGTSV